MNRSISLWRQSLEYSQRERCWRRMLDYRCRRGHCQRSGSKVLAGVLGKQEVKLTVKTVAVVTVEEQTRLVL